MARRVFIPIGPDSFVRPTTAENVRMRQGLIEAFPPATTTDIKPELIVDLPVIHQERVGRRQKHSILRLKSPALDVLGSHDTIAHHLDILLAKWLIPGVFGRDPTELLNGLNQIGRHSRGIVVTVKSEARL